MQPEYARRTRRPPIPERLVFEEPLSGVLEEATFGILVMIVVSNARNPLITDMLVFPFLVTK
jgi:hypothetical protein